MRHKRAKTYKRAIAVYTTAFGFRTPFQVLVSNDILLALNRESDIHKQLAACCQDEIKPMITQCCIEALYKLDPPQQPLVDLAKTFERRRCNHRTAIPPDECLTDVVGPTNKHRYVLAAQSKRLREALEAIPGLPLIHFNPRGVLVLSPPSRATLRTKDVQEEQRRLEGAGILEGVKDGDNVVGASAAAAQGGGSTAISSAKRNRVKGPNPLSVKKKKVSTADQKREEKKGEVERAAEVAGRSKKRRRRAKGAVKLAKEEIEAERAERAAREDRGGGGVSDAGSGEDSE